MIKIKLGVIGHQGRMGKEITTVITSSELAELSSCVSRETPDSATGDINSKVVESIAEVFTNSDVVIEFTNPTTMAECLHVAQKTKTPMVSGTTGHDLYDLMIKVAQTTPILWSANMSLGINILLHLVKQAAHKLSDDYDIEISEIHHANKKDAPSGTSLMLGKAAAEGRNLNLEDVKAINRYGPRRKGDIGFGVLRGGGVFGEHKVMFLGKDEYLNLGHVGLNRRLFAEGAVKAALWLYNQNNGLYSIQDMLHN